MPRDARAYLKDILDACAAIQMAVEGSSFADYESSRLVRSSVEREFIIIGEAAAALAKLAPEQFAGITRARRIVDFRNRLTHAYPTVDNGIVWAIVEHDIPMLRGECEKLLGEPPPSRLPARSASGADSRAELPCEHQLLLPAAFRGAQAHQIDSGRQRTVGGILTVPDLGSSPDPVPPPARGKQ